MFEPLFSVWNFVSAAWEMVWALPLWCKLLFVVLIVLRVGWPHLMADGSPYRPRRRRRWRYRHDY